MGSDFWYSELMALSSLSSELSLNSGQVKKEASKGIVLFRLSGEVVKW